MPSGLRHRLPKARHDSDSALLKSGQQSQTESEVEDLKKELVGRVKSWRHNLTQVGTSTLLYLVQPQTMPLTTARPTLLRVASILISTWYIA